jgi:hypothetical protein
VFGLVVLTLTSEFMSAYSKPDGDAGRTQRVYIGSDRECHTSSAGMRSCIILYRSTCTIGYKRSVREGVDPRSWHHDWKVCVGGGVLLLYCALSMRMDDLMHVSVRVYPFFLEDPASSFYSYQGEADDTCVRVMVLGLDPRWGMKHGVIW